MGIFVKHLLARSRVGCDAGKSLFELGGAAVALNQFGDYGSVGNEVDKGDVFYSVADKSSCNGYGDGVGAIADHLWHIEEGRLESGCARAHDGCMRVAEELVGAV